MSQTGTVYAIGRSTWGDRLRDSWTVTVTLSGGKDVAFPIARDSDTAPLTPGESVTVPRFTTGHITAHRPGGDVRIAMLDYAADPDAPLK
jgi:hypothetical protein